MNRINQNSQELTLNYEYCDWIDVDLEEYLLSLKGIYEVKINSEKSFINVKYYEEEISPNIIKYEISYYLSALKMPLLIGFDKHQKDNVSSYTFTIKDACCEFCLKGKIEDLLLIKGIISANTDFNFHNLFNVHIIITYNNKMINKNEIIKIEQELNS